METTAIDRGRGVVPVRVSLSCGWCAQQVFNAAGQMETAAGRLHLVNAPSVLRVAGGRPVCPRCGGPMFVDDWKVIRAERVLPAAGPDGEVEPQEARTAA